MQRPETAEFDFARIRPIYVGLVIGMFSSSISMTIVGPAIPRIIADLGGVQFYAWLSTIVMLVSAVITPISGKLSDMYGRRRFYIVGLVVFMLGSILSGAAQSFAWLVATRAIQGVGMGILMPLSQTILGDIIPPRQRGKYQSYMGAVMGMSQVAGPLIGGTITDLWGWRWLFYINLPVAIVALVFIVRYLHVKELEIQPRVDFAGIATMTIAVTSVLLGISLGGTGRWTDPVVLALLAAGTVAMVVFVLIERRAVEPILPLKLFSNSIFTFSVVAALFQNAALIAVLIYVPVYAQGVLGVSATESGAILIPMNVALFGMGIVIGILITRTGRYKEFALAGLAAMFVASLLLIRLDSQSSRLELTAYTLLFGLGLGMSFQIYTLIVQNAVQRRDLGVATSALQFFRNIGNALGTAVAGTIMTTGLVNGLAARMTPEVQGQLPPGGIDPNVVLHPSEMAALPPAVASVLRAALNDGTHNLFLLIPVLTVIVFGATMAIRVVPLRDTLSTPEERGQAILESTAMSSPDTGMSLVTRADAHQRSRERILGAHAALLAEQAAGNADGMLYAVVAEFGGGDFERGLQLLKSTGALLLSEDSAVIDAHEPFVVELSEHGTRRDMLSTPLTRRLEEVAARVADARPEQPTKPRLESARGVDESGLRRAIQLMDAALIADITLRRQEQGTATLLLDEPPAVPPRQAPPEPAQP